MDISTLIYIIIGWNLLVFIMFGIDKFKAVKGRWRISEKALLLSSFLMGGIGGLLGMGVFRHKTRHLKFKLLMPLAVILNIALVYLIFNNILWLETVFLLIISGNGAAW